MCDDVSSGLKSLPLTQPRCPRPLHRRVNACFLAWQNGQDRASRLVEGMKVELFPQSLADQYVSVRVVPADFQLLPQLGPGGGRPFVSSPFQELKQLRADFQVRGN